MFSNTANRCGNVTVQARLIMSLQLDSVVLHMKIISITLLPVTSP